MTDDWSLKGKAVTIMCGIQGMYVFPESKKTHLPKDAIFVYKKEVIETLRQKLIEDTDGFQNKLLSRLKADNETKNISEIINELFREYKEKMNRRFGVEDGEKK